MTARLQPLSRHTAAPDSGLVTQLQPVARQSIHTGACGKTLTEQILSAVLMPECDGVDECFFTEAGQLAWEAAQARAD